MYRILPNNRPTLISSDEVIATAPVNNDVDARQLWSAIQIAEESFIKSAMCKELYYDMRSKKNVEITSINKVYIETLMTEEAGKPVVTKIGEVINAVEFLGSPYVDLWHEILWKLVAETVAYIASPTNFSRFTAQGEMENNPSSPLEGAKSASVSLEKMQWKLKKMLEDRISPLLRSLDEWLFDYRSSFSANLLKCKQWKDYTNNDPTASPTATRGKTGWILGVYDDPNRGKCYSCKDQLSNK